MLLHGAPFFQTYPHNLYGCGRARKKNIAVRRNPPPPKQNAALRNSGRGTMSLAGAGQSPQSFTASAVSADRRNLFPHKQVADLRPIAARQSNAARRNPSLQAKRSFAQFGSRDDVPCGCRAEPAIFYRVSGQRRRRNLFPHKQVADLRPIAVRQSNAARRNPSLQAKRSLRLTAQRSTRLRRATFPPRTRPRRKAIGDDSPRALPSKIPHAPL